MGSPSYEAGRSDNEGPTHRVSVASLAVGKFELTRGQFAAFVNATGYNAGSACNTFEGGKGEKRSGRNWQNPGYSQGDKHPAVCLNWDDAKAYVTWLARKTGKGYRLLSEAEWEYATRAGTTTARYWGDSPDQACGYANVMDATGKSQVPGVTWEAHNCTDGSAYTANAGSYKPNAFGLYDMIGNAWEWTEDCWNDNYNGAPTDGSAWTGEACGRRVLRGSAWGNIPQDARSAKRGWGDSAVRGDGSGFRLGRMLDQDSAAKPTPMQSETIIHGQEWADSDNGANIDWNEATRYCASKGSGWRLPTVAELQGNYAAGQPTPCGPYECRVASKSRLTVPWFWSNERKGSSEAWYVNLGNGTLAAVQVDGWLNSQRALCVRRP
jgi:formylglycine-generating enzyme required for sulfatase activity